MKQLNFNRILLHLAWWIFFVAFYIVARLYSHEINTGAPIALGDKINLFLITWLPTFTLMGMAYAHLYVLLPTYLYKKKYVHYIIGIAVVILIFTPFYLYFTDWVKGAEKVILNEPYEAKYNTWKKAFTPGISVFIKAGLPSLITIATMTTGLKYAKNAAQRLQQTEELEQKQLETELSLLKTQVNPHFFFNTLNNLYALAKRGSEKTVGTLDKFSELMHYMVHDCKNKLVPLMKEFTFIQSYLELEKLRLNERAKVNYTIEGNVNGYKIEPLLFISFIENAFKHGVNSQLQGAYVNIDFALQGEKLKFSIENNYDDDSKTKGGQFGLSNIKRRLAILYPQQHQLNIQDDGNVYRVDLELELKH